MSWTTNSWPGLAAWWRACTTSARSRRGRLASGSIRRPTAGAAPGRRAEAGGGRPRAAGSSGPVVEPFWGLIEPWFDQVPYQPIHGDCHLGNVLWGTQGPLLVDFDDMVRGPCVQDLWVIVPGRDEQ